MTKIEVVAKMKDDEFFEATHDILETIAADTVAEHAAANRHAAGLARSIDNMKEWVYFDARMMLDLTAQLYGFVRGLLYSNLDLIADIEEDVEWLHNAVSDACIKVIAGDESWLRN